MLAIVREPGTTFVQAISSHPLKNTLDYKVAQRQHFLYVEALKNTGVEVLCLDRDETHPDSPFVEDPVFILPPIAWVCSMKARSRHGEVDTLLPILRKYLQVETLERPCYIDGGDVLVTPDTVFIGMSARTNREAILYLKTKISRPVVPVAVMGGLHLKTSACYLGRNVMVLEPSKVETSPFKGFEWVLAEEGENANCLAIGNRVIMAAGYPRLAQSIQAKGFETIEVPITEFEKADGGVTCLSLMIP